MRGACELGIADTVAPPMFGKLLNNALTTERAQLQKLPDRRSSAKSPRCQRAGSDTRAGFDRGGIAPAPYNEGI